MRLHLSSEIVLNTIPEEFYAPKNAVERSEITRQEKIRTDIFPKVDDAARSIADAIVAEVKAKEVQGKYCVLCVGTGQSHTPDFNE